MTRYSLCSDCFDMKHEQDDYTFCSHTYNCPFIICKSCFFKNDIYKTQINEFAKWQYVTDWDNKMEEIFDDMSVEGWYCKCSKCVELEELKEYKNKSEKLQTQNNKLKVLLFQNHINTNLLKQIYDLL